MSMLLLEFRSRPMSSSIFGRHTQADVQDKGRQGLQQHEGIKGAVKWHIFCGDDPAGPIFKDEKLVDYEERHLRKDNIKSGDITAPDPACRPTLCRGNWLWMLWQSPAHLGLPSGMARRHHRIRSCMMARETSLVQTPDPGNPSRQLQA